eukprot:TRINITY_DN26872_c0_g1_i1.p1 TRINITY_DN26872_c0_g1~~TRINITY_DN26872_c0_g1_i1.p1  ORF type:complete len:550 (-),score=145.60 TRINITY_DN26872_c0_g1_i1:137-1786(-)
MGQSGCFGFAKRSPALPPSGSTTTAASGGVASVAPSPGAVGPGAPAESGSKKRKQGSTGLKKGFLLAEKTPPTRRAAAPAAVRATNDAPAKMQACSTTTSPQTVAASEPTMSSAGDVKCLGTPHAAEHATAEATPAAAETIAVPSPVPEPSTVALHDSAVAVECKDAEETTKIIDEIASEDKSVHVEAKRDAEDEAAVVATEVPEEVPQLAGALPEPEAIVGSAEPAGWVDITTRQDGSIRKFIVVASSAAAGVEEGVTPTDGAGVSFDLAWRFASTTDLSFPEPATDPWVFEPATEEKPRRRVSLTIGNCVCCDALESALISMKRDETCLVRCYNPADWTDEDLGLQSSAATTTADGNGDATAVDLLITMTWVEKEKDVEEMDPVERVKYAAERKDAAGKYFAAKRYVPALHKYKLVAEVTEYVDDIKDIKAQNEAKSLKLTAKLNAAFCHMKLEEWEKVVRSCTEVLVHESNNEKALFRRATAYHRLENYVLAEVDLKRCLEKSPQNNEARRLLAQCKAEHKESGMAQKDVYAKMLKGAAKPRARKQ